MRRVVRQDGALITYMKEDTIMIATTNAQGVGVRSQQALNHRNATQELGWHGLITACTHYWSLNEAVTEAARSRQRA